MSQKQSAYVKKTLRKEIGDLLKSRKYKLERDGWTQFNASYFVKAGFPKAFIEPLIQTFKSDGSYKGSLWKDDMKGIIAWREMSSAVRKLADDHNLKEGDPMPDDWTKLVPSSVLDAWNEVYIPEQKGVYYLDFLRALERLFGVKAEGYMGRGYQAGAIINAVHKHLGIDEDEFGKPFEKIP